MYAVYSDAKLKVEDGSRIICGEIGVLKYALVFNPDFTSHRDFGFRSGHIQFYALTHGWQQYTETGYKSQFFNYRLDVEKTDDDILILFDSMLRCSPFDYNAAKQCDLFSVA